MTGGYPELRASLAEEFASRSPVAIQRLVERQLGPVDADALEDVLGTLKDVGGAASKALPQILPGAMAGAATGAQFGGPWGALIGGALGALGSATSPRSSAGTPRPGVSAPPAVAQQRGAVSSPSDAPAAAQLLQTILRPEVIQSLVAALLGQAGRKDVPVGTTEVPVGAILNLIGTLGQRAATEYNEAVPRVSESIPEYLVGPDGNCRCDLACGQERASALLEVFAEADALETRQHWEPSALLSDYHDQLDLADMYYRPVRRMP